MVRHQDMVAAFFPGPFRFLIGTDDANYGGAQMFCPLRRDGTDTACRSVQQDRVAGLHGIAAAQKVPGRQSLSRTAAACSSDIPSGIGTSRLAG